MKIIPYPRSSSYELLFFLLRLFSVIPLIPHYHANTCFLLYYAREWTHK